MHGRRNRGSPRRQQAPPISKELLPMWIGHGEIDAVNEYCAQRNCFGFLQRTVYFLEGGQEKVFVADQGDAVGCRLGYRRAFLGVRKKSIYCYCIELAATSGHYDCTHSNVQQGLFHPNQSTQDSVLLLSDVRGCSASSLLSVARCHAILLAALAGPGGKNDPYILLRSASSINADAHKRLHCSEA